MSPDIKGMDCYRNQIIQKWLPSENALIYNPKGKEDNREPRKYSFEVYVMYKI